MLEQAVVGRQRFDDDGRDLVAALSEHGFERGNVVERQDERLFGKGSGHARGRGLAKRDEARARADEQVVGVAVVAARKLDDQVAPLGAARETNRAHRCFGARRHKTHHIEAWVHRRDAFGEQHLRFARRAKGRALGGGASDRLDDGGVRVAKDQRTPRLHKVEPFVAVDVEGAAAECAFEHGGRTADGGEGAHRRRHAGGNHAAGAFENFMGAGLRDHSQPPWRASRAWYVMRMSAPARAKACRFSETTAASSTQPRSAAALTIEYSPETL